MHLSVVCPTYTWSVERKVEFTCLSLEQAPIPGAQSCKPFPYISLTNIPISLHIPYKYPHISLLCTVCDRKIYMVGICGIHKEFSITNLSGLGQCRPSTKPLRRIPTANLPLFLQHLPQVCQVGHTIDRSQMYVFRESSSSLTHISTLHTAGLCSFRLALVQLAVGADKAANLQRASQKIKEAARNGAKVVALPVCMVLINYLKVGQP